MGFSEDDKAKEPRKGVDCENMNDERFNLREQYEGYSPFSGARIYDSEGVIAEPGRIPENHDRKNKWRCVFFRVVQLYHKV